MIGSGKPREALREDEARERYEAIECTQASVVHQGVRGRQRQDSVRKLRLKRQFFGRMRWSIQKKKSSSTSFMRGVDFVGLKIKAKWLNRMREVHLGFATVKTIECRVYPPAPKLRIGDTFYLLCSGEVRASAVLQELRVYTSPAEFKADVANHQVTEHTCERTGRTSYESFVRAFSRGRRVIFGYVLSAVHFLEPRPKSAERFAAGNRVVNVPDFFGQRHGQTFATCSFPKLHDT
jgi:hypothetical protein